MLAENQDGHGRAAHYRNCAADARRQAQRVATAEASQALISIAELWERLAVSAEAHTESTSH